MSHLIELLSWFLPALSTLHSWLEGFTLNIYISKYLNMLECHFTLFPRSSASNSGPRKANPAPSMVPLWFFKWEVNLTLVLLSFVPVTDDDVTPVELLWLPQLSVMMEDLWGVAVGVFQLWMFMVVFLIMLPAMCGLSLGVTGVYIQILVKTLEVGKRDNVVLCISPE